MAALHHHHRPQNFQLTADNLPTESLDSRALQISTPISNTALAIHLYQLVGVVRLFFFLFCFGGSIYGLELAEIKS